MISINIVFKSRLNLPIFCIYFNTYIMDLFLLYFRASPKLKII